MNDGTPNQSSAPANWQDRVLLDDCDKGLLTTHRLEVRRGTTPGYWKVVVVPRGVSGKDRKFTILARKLLNAPDGMFVDHINGDTFDNRRANLRLCSASQNNCNRKAPERLSYRGVVPQKVGFVAAIGFGRRKTHIGTFPTAAEAARAYDQVARELHGEFARLNFPNETAGAADRDEAGCTTASVNRGHAAPVSNSFHIGKI